MNEYNSSIIFKYGDIDKVKDDSKVLHDIISRQGSTLLIDVIAEHIGQANLNHNFSDIEKNRILTLTVNELKYAILERI